MIRPVIAGLVVALVGAACSGDEPTEAVNQTPAASIPVPTETTAASAPDVVDTSPTTSVETATTTSTTMSTAPTTTATNPAPTTTVAREEPAPFAVSDDVPDIDMFDAATGATVNLRTVVKGEKPLMFWFWSPF